MTNTSHGSADPRLRTSIRQTHEPDIADVIRRLEAADIRSRRRALVGGGILTIALLLVLANVYAGRDGAIPSPAPPAADQGSEDSGVVAAEDVPLGSWLIHGESSGAFVSSAGTTLDLKNVRAYDISPDGTSVAATSAEQIIYGEEDDPSALSLTVQRNLLVLDTASGSWSDLADAGPRGTIIGPVRWSPDGSEVAYRRTTWAIDPREEHPLDRIDSEVVCVVGLDGSESRCFASTEGVLSFDWNPAGTGLVVHRGGSELAEVDSRSGAQRTIVGPEGTPSIRSVFDARGWGSLLALIEPRWSPSGTYVAALAQTSAAGSLPLVLDLSGRVVAWGSANQDYQILAWSPSEDVLAYTTGVQIEPDPSEDDWTVELLTPSPREVSTLVSFTGPAALISGLVWSPDGRILAVDGSENEAHDVVTLVDAAIGQVIDRVPIASRVPDSLVDWGPSSQ